MKKNSKTVKNAANEETKGAEASSDAVKGAAQKTKNAISVSQKAMVGVQTKMETARLTVLT